jgi:N-acetylneuraminate synthase
MVGLSDHTMGTAVSIAAIALGAVVIEKHFTLSRKDKGPDSEFSLEPDELERLCGETKSAWLALGKSGFERQKAEEVSKVFRRSIYFVRDLNEGHIVQSVDIRRIRPGMGLPPKHFNEILGKKLTKTVERGTPVSWSLLTD